MSYWQVKVKVETEDERGKVSKLTEMYMVDAVSATDAETKVHTEFKGGDYYDFKVTDCKETKIIKILE